MPCFRVTVRSVLLNEESNDSIALFVTLKSDEDAITQHKSDSDSDKDKDTSEDSQDFGMSKIAKILKLC